MRICVVPNDMDGPGHYRLIWPARQLKEHGVDVVMPPYKENSLEIGGRVRYQGEFSLDFNLPIQADLYVLQQWKERMFSETGIRSLRSWGSATSMDVDDNYINIPAYNPAFYGSHPYKSDRYGRILNRQERRAIKKKTGYNPAPNSLNRLHMLDIIRQVDLLTVSTPFLAEVYDSYHDDIRVVRNSVDWDVWSDVTPQYEVTRDRPRIGWFGDFAFRQPDLQVIEYPLIRYLKTHPEVEFVTNDAEVHDYLGVPEKQRVTIGKYDFYDRENGLYRVGGMTAHCDVGLVPLAMNDLNRGKSHLKGMEYNAAGIPFIASPTESYKDYWCNWKNGMIADTSHDWYDAIDLYIGNDQIRKSGGMNGRHKAEQESLQHTWRRWHRVYEDLLGDSNYATARKAIPIGSVQKFSELGKLLRIVAEKKPKVIVEIGTARGGTFWAIAQTAPDDALLISMDIPAGSPMDIKNGKDAYGARNRELIRSFAKPDQDVRLIDINSQIPQALHALQAHLGGKKIDLLFIDGDHRYEGVKHDYETYGKLVNKGGIIAFHDIITHVDKRVGVVQLWNEITPTRVTEELIGKENWGAQPWGGIGVIHV